MIDVGLGTTADLPPIRTLLVDLGLPLDGLDASTALILARDRDGVVGSAAFEEYHGGVLLRSVAVAARVRGTGLGTRLTDAALAEASRRGHRTAYLLTTTASDFFPRFGFVRIDRADVPEDVRGSVEFTSACPASAVVMRLPLADGREG